MLLVCDLFIHIFMCSFDLPVGGPLDRGKLYNTFTFNLEMLILTFLCLNEEIP